MNHQTPSTPQISSAELSGIALVILRIGWLLISATIIVITVVGLATLNYTLQLPCEPQAYDACLIRDEALRSLNISRAFYANWITIGIIIELFPAFVAGILLFWRRSQTWFGLLLSLSIMLVVVTIDPDVVSWTEFAYPGTEGVINIVGFLSGSLIWVWFFFPSGQLSPRWLLWLIAFKLVHNVGLWFFPGSFLDTTTVSPNLHLGINYAFALLLAGVLIYRYRYRSNIKQRQQIKWVVVAALFLIFIYIVQELLFLQVESERQRIIANLTVTSVFYIAAGLLPVSIIVAVFQYRLFDIDIIIQRTLQYSILSVLLAAVYFGSITLIQGGITAVTSAQSPLAIVLSTLLIAALFNPLRRRVQDVIDRRFYRRKYDAQQVLARFAVTARDETDLEKLVAELEQVVEGTMQPEKAGVWLRHS